MMAPDNVNAPTVSPATRKEPVCWRMKSRMASENIPRGRRPRTEVMSNRLNPDTLTRTR